MKHAVAIFFLLALCVPILAQRSEDVSEPSIVAGKGWGKICLGADIQTVEAVLGEGENRSKYDDVYFKDYPAKGIQISYNNSDNTVHYCLFLQRAAKIREFSTAQAKTSKRVDWKSKPKGRTQGLRKAEGKL